MGGRKYSKKSWRKFNKKYFHIKPEFVVLIFFFIYVSSTVKQTFDSILLVIYIYC